MLADVPVGDQLLQLVMTFTTEVERVWVAEGVMTLGEDVVACKLYVALTLGASLPTLLLSHPATSSKSRSACSSYR